MTRFAFTLTVAQEVALGSIDYRQSVVKVKQHSLNVHPKVLRTLKRLGLVKESTYGLLSVTAKGIRYLSR